MFDKGEHDRLKGGRALEFLGLGSRPTLNGERIFHRIHTLGADPTSWGLPAALPAQG